MEKDRRFFALISLIIIVIMVVPAGCATSNDLIQAVQDLKLSPTEIQPDQFTTVAKDGVELACPQHWQIYSSDPSLVYGVSRVETIRIVIGVLPAADKSYYEGLMDQGIGYRTNVAGYPAYRIDNTYTWNGHEITNWCITAVNGGKACHFMFLCDTSMMADYAPIFQYVLNSLKFQ